jgi:hypothetical protein
MGQGEDALQKTLDELDKSKYQFLNSVENAVEGLIIRTQRRDCVAIVEVSSSGSKRRIGMSDPKDYTRRFIVLLKSKNKEELPTYNGAKLDSYLSEPILAEVTELWTRYYHEESDVISNGMVDALKDDPQVFKELMIQIASALRSTASPLTERMNEAIYHILTQEVSSHISQHTMTEISHQVASVLTSTAGQHIVISVSVALVKALSSVLGKLLIKCAGTAAFKTALVGFAKKMVIKSVVTGVFTSIAASAGVATTGSMFLWVVIPLIAAFAGYEIHEFPRKLASKVAPQVKNGLSGEFRSSNESALREIFKQAVVGNLTQIAEAVVGDSDFVHTVKDAAKEWLEKS